MPYIVNLARRYCEWCGIDSDSARVVECVSCGHMSCHECMRLYDEGTLCKHTTPAERHVLVRQDWGDD